MTDQFTEQIGRQLSKHTLADTAIAERKKTAKIMLIIGILLIPTIIGLPLLGTAIRSRKDADALAGLFISVHEGGLVYATDAEQKIVKWQDVQSVLVNAYTLKNKYFCSFVFTFTDGTTWKLGELDAREILNLQLMVSTVQKALGPHLLTHAVQTVEANETAQFGKIGVDKMGLKVGKKRHLWADVQKLVIKQGQLQLFLYSKATSSRVAEAKTVPNAFCLPGLVDCMRQLQPV